MSKTKNTTIELTPRELAFIKLCRAIGEGYFEGVGVNEGQPTILKGVVQRIDLKRPAELAMVLEGSGVPIADVKNLGV